MKSTSFDDYADEYQDVVQDAVQFTGQSAEAFTQIKVRHLVEQAERHLGTPEGLSILDVGSGVGITDRYLVDIFKHVNGVDISAESIRTAAAANPKASYTHYDGSTLPFADGGFDLAFAICVLHHVAPSDWDRFVTEMHRVVRPGGLVLVFEHNPWNPLTRLAVSRCPFDRDAVLLRMSRLQNLLQHAGLELVERRFILFTPWVTSLWRALDRALWWLPLGGQYMIAARRPERTPSAWAA